MFPKTKTDLNSFQCDKCDREYENKDELLTHIKKIHDAEEKSENYRMFLKDQRSKMKTMTQTQLFDLVDKINKRDQTP